jgi:hypothetical protein
MYILLIFLILFIILYYIKNYKLDSFINVKNLNFKLLNKCQVPTLDTYQCYLSKYYECPIENGSYLQCTNNYLPKPTEGNCDCSNRTFEMCPYPFKLSENCYYKNLE